MAAKMKTKPRVKAKRKKQAHLPGMEPPTIKSIERAAEEYRYIRDDRMALGKKEQDAHAKLLALMKEHSLTCYEFDEFRVELDSTTKVRVRKKKDDSETNGDDKEE